MADAPNILAPIPAYPLTDARDEQRYRVLVHRWLTMAGNVVNVPVTTAATSLVVVFPRQEVDTKYGVQVTPNWSTTTYWSGKTTTQVTLNFSVGAPAGAQIDLITFRSET